MEYHHHQHMVIHNNPLLVTTLKMKKNGRKPQELLIVLGCEMAGDSLAGVGRVYFLTKIKLGGVGWLMA